MSDFEKYNDLAREAYTAYYNHTGGKSIATGDNIPEYDRLPRMIQDCWIATVKHLASNKQLFDQIQ